MPASVSSSYNLLSKNLALIVTVEELFLTLSELTHSLPRVVNQKLFMLKIELHFIFNTIPNGAGDFIIDPKLLSWKIMFRANIKVYA